MAIAISIGNSEKFTKLDFMGKIMDGNSFPSKCQFVTLSNVSKGIQKINQILKTSCSNGSSVNNSDTCSIKVVEKELLKGAMDLESSLRMLVNLQEASSNHINSSQRRNQHVTSLVEDEYRVDDVKTADQKQLDLPRFSFDKPSKKSYTKKETRDGGKNEFLALTYHKRSISCIPEFKDDSANLEPKSQSTSLTHGAGKGRISNVIAKLMGLDEFPQNANLKASGQSTSKKGSGNFLKNEREPTDNNNFLKQHTTEKDDPHPILPQKLKIEAAENLSPEKNKHMKKNDIHRKENNVGEKGAKSVKQNLDLGKPEGKQVKAKVSQSSKNNKPREPSPDRVKTAATKPTFAKHRAQEKPIKEPSRKKKENHIQVQRKDPSKNIFKRQLPISQVKKRLKCNMNRSSGLEGRLVDEHSTESKSRNVSEPETSKAGEEIWLCEAKDSCNDAGDPKYLASDIPNENQQDTAEERNHNDADQSHTINSQNLVQNHQEGPQELFQDHEITIAATENSENTLTGSETSKLIPKRQNEPLTEPEKNLKESLTKSHLFHSTAEALFNLNLPPSVLHHASDHQINEGAADRLLTVDIAYEVMRRKERRQEISVHPCARITSIISDIKVGSLDDLIKQLRKDFDELASYGHNGSEEWESTQHFDDMLTKDMQNRNSDINSMWDLGWDRTMFAFLEKDEIAKDVERRLLKGLIHEVAMDLL
ncbi:unnamed protein product [Cuscuta campestris]|uniref:DUF3741 domain-containing protein n=1 Tax=Cuscuta campestris TaxID=132261 RepID=A0A484KMP4_9ASTE|nr:unnamed protein product [Cuscuta campestris]